MSAVCSFAPLIARLLQELGLMPVRPTWDLSVGLLLWGIHQLSSICIGLLPTGVVCQRISLIFIPHKS